MRHLAPSLILLIVPAVAQASTDALTTPARPGCTYASAEGERSSTATAASVQAPAAATNKTTTGQRSNSGGDEELIPRGRNQQWHRFLPGMFR